MRAVIVADSAAVHADATDKLVASGQVELIRHLDGRSDVTEPIEGFRPDIVLVDEMQWPPLALTRIAEARRAAPHAALIVRAGDLEGRWLARALRAGASAVIPAETTATTFIHVLGDVLAPTQEVA